MILSELIQRSPVRIFENSIHGGLGSGEIGIIASKAGIGKTSVLVQLAMDKLLQGKKVIHVSYTQHTHHVFSWYEDIFDEFINKKDLENVGDIKNDIVKNRVVMNFNQDGMPMDQVMKSLRAMIVEGGFKAESVIIDGFDFLRAGREHCLLTSLAGVKAFAGELGLSVWYSCTVDDEAMRYDKQNIPLAVKDFFNLIDIIITLEPDHDHIDLYVSKDRDSCDTHTLSMRLDPKTLLIREGG